MAERGIALGQDLDRGRVVTDMSDATHPSVAHGAAGNWQAENFAKREESAPPTIWQGRFFAKREVWGEPDRSRCGREQAEARRIRELQLQAAVSGRSSAGFSRKATFSRPPRYRP